MYVTSMLIDGFKSYGQRTEVQGFDPLFNAITGLNGSGKSNILDGICFVLGITNLSHVRATNLQELVYKNGQAGVTRAIVSITFNNSDKAQSPLGYEQYDEITITRQVVVGGRNKYAINGVNVQNSRVQDMFRSVKLNVNNPHFLIMQGRITKVLNMKPPEILSMIEEAAGTRLYESKKQSAIKTIEKKDAKLKEISDIVDEEISPTMTKLKQEKAVCLEFQKIQREYDHLKKFCIACKYVSLQKRSEQLKEDEGKTNSAIGDARDAIEQNKSNADKLDHDIHQLQLQRDNEAGGVLKSLEEALDQKVKSEAKCSAALKGVRDNLKAEERKKTALQKGMDDDHAALVKKEKLMSEMQQMFDQLRSAADEREQQLTEAQKRFQAVSAGLSTDADGQSATLAQHMMNAKASLAEAETAHKQASMRHKHAKQDLSKRSAALKTTDAEFKRDKSKLDKIRADVEQIQKNMTQLGFDEQRVDELDAERRQLNSQLTVVQDDVDRVISKFPQLSFDYRDPEAGFDRSAICGPVARLMTLNRPDAATALEVTAGSKLSNIVVKTEVVGKKLLERGQLQRRVTFIPLNQIMARGIDNDTLRHAEKLVGKENVCTALSCISYDQEVHKAMVWVFGSTFICKDLDCAKKVAFDARIQRRAVTLDGDVVDPAGTLTGGSRSNRQSMLEQLHSVADSSSKIRQLQQKLDLVQSQLGQMEPNRDRYQRLKQQQELRSHELKLLEDRVQQSSHCQLQQELDQLQLQIGELEQAMSSSLATQQQEKQKVSRLEEQLRDQKKTREKQLKQAEAEVKQCRSQAETARQAWHAKQEDEERMRLEIADLRSSGEQAEQQISAVTSALQQLAEQLSESEQEAARSKTALTEAKADVKRQKEVLSSQNREISQLAQQRDQLTQTSKQRELEIMKLDHQLEKIRAEAADSTETIRRMTEDHEWISADRRFFGQPGTSYDFSAMDPADANRRIAKLDDHRSKLGKSVNMRAMKMLDKAEEQYNDLMRKKRIVENDKSKIERFIEELDDKKNDALKKAWLQVNKDFGSIFSTLLPGTNAKLQPPEGQGVLDGLEVRVAFGNVWKDSLSELSGGQRSLVALSLILALLLFKPAPIYILDEVDAALDLSHTQNIGTMLRTHFKHSQFIVVSLKDGMFNNANVLFKTKFVDGMSTVARFTQHVPLGSRH